MVVLWSSKLQIEKYPNIKQLAVNLAEAGAKLPSYKSSPYEIYDKIKDKQEIIVNQEEQLNPVERKLLQDLKIVESVASELIQLDTEGNYGDEAFRRYKILIVAKTKLEDLANNSSGYSMVFREKLFGVNGKVNKIISRCKFMDKGRSINPVPFMQKEMEVARNPFDDDDINTTKNVRLNPFDDFKGGSRNNNNTDVKFGKKTKGDEKGEDLKHLDFGLKGPVPNKIFGEFEPKKQQNFDFEDFLDMNPPKKSLTGVNQHQTALKGKLEKDEFLNIDPNSKTGDFDIDLI